MINAKTAAHLVWIALSTTRSVDGFTSSPQVSRLQQQSGVSALGSTLSPEKIEKLVSTNEEPEDFDKKSWDDDGFVFGLEGSGLERPKGKVAQIVLEGDSLETTNTQRAVVWSTFAGHLALATYSINEIFHANQGLFGSFADDSTLTIGLTAIQTLLITLTSWILADLGSGVLHWSVDNYGNGKTPIMGGIIAAFQGHHSAPWTICERGFENNVSKLCIPFGVQTVLAMKVAFGLGPIATLFWTVFSVMEILSQEFHKMSHATKSEAGPIWTKLQDIGLTIDRKSHAQHHIAPYDGNYCIISGICNKSLDESGFFRRLEYMVYKINGVESNAWKLDSKLRERTLRGEYGLPESS